MSSLFSPFRAAALGCLLLQTLAAATPAPTARLHPRFLTLRDGKTQQQLRVELRDATGNLLPIAGATIRWTSDDPQVAQVDQTGNVRGLRFGQTRIRAAITRDGQEATAVAVVNAGHLRLEPPYVRLALNATTTAQLRIDAANADGTPADLSGKPVAFRVDIPGGGVTAATVDANGKVTAVRPGLVFVGATVGGVPVHNSAPVRVIPYSDGIEYTRYQEDKIAFIVPKRFREADYQQIFRDYQVPRVTNIGYGILEEMAGKSPFDGDIHFLSNDLGGDVTRAGYSTEQEDPTVPCGGSGNPTQLGTDISIARSSRTCAILTGFDSPLKPWWFIYFHEWGHDFTFVTSSFGSFVSQQEVPNSNTAYVEGMASASSLFATRMILARNDQYKIDPAILQNMMSVSFPAYGYFRSLSDYVAAGADYSKINPDIVDEILINVFEEFGYGAWYRFSSLFASDPESAWPFDLNTNTRQATFVAAGMSAAARHDLRARFRGWGFPIDDAYYAQIYPEVERLAGWRDPAAYAGKDRSAQANQPVALGDAETFDPENSPLRLEWRVVSQPDGSSARLSDAALLHPTFTADRPGEYLLSLTAADDIATGKPAYVRVRIAGAAACAPSAVPDSFAPDGGTARIRAAAGCAAVPSNSVPWITATAASDGVNITAAPNPSAKAREAAIVVSGQGVAVRQAGARCTFTLETRDVTVPPEGGEGTVGFTASAQDCQAVPYSFEPWLTATIEGSRIRYRAAETLRVMQRRALITLPGAALLISQQGLPGCALTLGSYAKTYPVTGSSELIALGRSRAGCTPVTFTDQPWATVWAEDGGLRLVVDPNPTREARTAKITADGQQMTVWQAGTAVAAPVFKLDRGSVSMEAAGGQASVTVTPTPATTAWAAVPHADWLFIASGNTGTGAGTVTFGAMANAAGPRTGVITIGPETVTVTQAGIAIPVVSEGGAANAADYSHRFAPGMILSLFGEALSPDGLAVASELPLPWSLKQVQVEVDDGTRIRIAPVFYVSQKQINAQLPFDLAGTEARITVKTGTGQSAPSVISLSPQAPALFMNVHDGKKEAIVIRNSDWTLVTAGTPLRPGEWVFLYANGLGAVAPELAEGAPGGDGAALGPLNYVTKPVIVSVGGKTVTPVFAGAAPRLAGVYQVNFQVPDGIPTGDADVVVSVGGVSSQTGVTVPCSAH